MSLLIEQRATALCLVAAAAIPLLQPACAQAQWWKRAPADFEECADTAEKAATKQEKTAALADCNAKFAGRRKPGGGYSYYDFLQDRTFDIAGPNPTPEEQKKIDQQYAVYLGNQRRDNLAAEAAAKQQEQQQSLQLAARSEPESVRSEPEKARSETGRVPVPHARPQAAALYPRQRPKPACAQDSFSCNWPRLSEGFNELKKLFNPPPNNKAKKS